MKDYPTTRKGRIDTLKGILCGVQRVPSLLMFSPESALGDLNLQDFEVLPLRGIWVVCLGNYPQLFRVVL